MAQTFFVPCALRHIRRECARAALRLGCDPDALYNEVITSLVHSSLTDPAIMSLRNWIAQEDAKRLAAYRLRGKEVKT